ncbi:MAG: hypothetical protein WCS42_27490, partial [Verrucomicrobiota bacterium]
MPYDPTLPVNLSPIRATELRDQFNALKALIDAQAAQLAVQAAQIEALQAHFPPPAPDISNGPDSSVDATIAKSAVSAAPGA